jgi:predicted ribosomally synthesized peptide with SipW-like signal peptide
MKKNISKQAKIGVVAGAMALSVLAGGALAYFSGSTNVKENTYHIVHGAANLDGEGAILEPGWDEQKEVDSDEDGITDVLQAMPGQTFDKDPFLVSYAEYSALPYIRVKVPTISAMKDGDTEAKVYDAFTINYTNDSDWTLVEDQSSVSTSIDTPSVYVYRYNSALKACTEELESTDEAGKDNSTSTLFETITVPDFVSIEEQDAQDGDILVDGALVQSEGFTADGADGTYSADAEAKAIFANMDDADADYTTQTKAEASDGSLG